MKTKRTLVYGLTAVVITLLFCTLSLTGCPNEPAHEHQWGAWITTTAATCTTKGLETRTCTLDISHKDFREIPLDMVNGHDWGEWAGTVTCETGGTGTRVCSRNKDHTETNPNLPPLGHDYQNWVVTTAPTCTTTGVETGTCTHDSSHKDTRIVAIDPNAHDYGNWTQTKAATATADGEETGTCSRDSSHKGTRPLYATGTTGLAFELINGNAYRVSRGTVDSGAVHIPAYWRGNSTNYADYKPVTEIAGSADEWYNGAFTNTSITVVHIPETITFIGNYAFQACTSLASVTFASGSKLETIGEGAFWDCTSLTSITIPASVTTIEGWGAFHGCTSLASVTFASDSRLETIGDGTFFQCESLTSITFPASVTAIGDWAFDGCASLASITVDVNNPNYASQGGILYNKAKTSIVLIPPAISGSVTIPEGVTSIDGFSGCTSLTSITIPASVTSIGGGWTFGRSINLTSITVNANNPNYSSEGGILYNKAKTEIIAYPSASGAVTIPPGVTSIANDAFGGCRNLTTLIIHAGVTNIGENFADCTSLTSFTVAAGNPNYTGEGGILYNKAKTEIITYPSANGTVTIPAGVTSISAWAFADSHLTGIIIPEGVTSIGDGAFGTCTSLTGNVDIPASITSIGAWTFVNTNITGITLPSSVTSIGEGAFRSCTSLSSITIPSSVTYVGGQVFYGWTFWQTINIQGSTGGWAQNWQENCYAQIY